MPSVYDFSARRLDGNDERLSRYRGDVLLIVNTASKCGFTSQYEGLESLHRDLSPKGFSVLGFPCNQFGHQEPGDAAAIGSFCQANYGVSFPLFAKIDVNGDRAHPLFKYLKAAKPGLIGSQSIKWNFTKFLVDRAGDVVARFGPMVKPRSIAGEIDSLL